MRIYMYLACRENFKTRPYFESNSNEVPKANLKLYRKSLPSFQVQNTYHKFHTFLPN